MSLVRLLAIPEGSKTDADERACADRCAEAVRLEELPPTEGKRDESNLGVAPKNRCC